MITQRLFCLTAVALAAMTLSLPGTGWEDHHTKHFEECAKVCAGYQVECEKNFHHCFNMLQGGKNEHAKAMYLSVGCAEFCTILAKLTARKSELSIPACEACAKAYDACAAECEKFPDMPEMKACRDMVKIVGHDHEKK
jgi:hypothetical protein